MNDEGNLFAQAYYAGPNGLHGAENSYVSELYAAFPDSETLYHVPDTWATFDTLAPLIRARFEAWRNAR